MPLPTFGNVLTPDRERGHPLTATGTTIFVLNTNTEVLTDTNANDVKDPWNIIAGNASAHANVRPVNVPPGAGLYLDLRHAYTGSGSEVSTAPQVRVYGLVPPWNGAPQTNDRRWPSDDTAAFHEFSATEGWWIELQDSGGSEIITLDNEAGNQASTIYVNSTTGENNIYVSRGRYVHLQGVIRVLVSVVRAAIFTLDLGSTLTTDEPTTGLVIGRFVG